MKVGDELAFISRNGILIRKIDRITPSGRLVCGPYTLNANLKIRGEQDSFCRIRVEPATDEHRKKVERSRLLQEVRRCCDLWELLTTEQLQSVLEIVKAKR